MISQRSIWRNGVSNTKNFSTDLSTRRRPRSLSFFSEMLDKGRLLEADLALSTRRDKKTESIAAMGSRGFRMKAERCRHEHYEVG